MHSIYYNITFYLHQIIFNSLVWIFRIILIFLNTANRKTSIATDLQITAAEKRLLHSKSNNNNIQKREARAIRRKNFLDVCKEAIKLKII